MSEKKFDTDKQKSALKWLEEKWPQGKRQCEICGAQDWSVTTDFTTPLVIDGGELKLRGRGYPNVSIICQNCGNTKYFNAVKMGLLDGTNEQSNDKS